MGDIHQPLHVSYGSDRGGNTIKVDIFNRHNVKLHAVWDSLLIKNEHADWEAYTAQITSGISSSQRDQWKAVTDPSEWANESFQLAVTNAYVNAGNWIRSGDQLGQSYYTRNLPVIEERLAMGGVRLARLLNTIFAPGDGQLEVHHYVGSRRSDVYHYPDCAINARIKAHNLVYYQSAPQGKRLHKWCPW